MAVPERMEGKMQKLNPVNYALLAILLGLVGYFLLLQENEVGMEVHQVNVNSMHNFYKHPVIIIRADHNHIFAGEEYTREQLVKRLFIHFYQQPFERLQINAHPDVKHEALVTLSNEIKTVLPETRFVWELESQTD